MIKTIFEEREAIGEARGKAEAGRNLVLTALRTKFKKVPKDVEKAVLAICPTRLRWSPCWRKPSRATQ
jgi:hypothetical protein